MHLLGARFESTEAARAALRELRARYDLTERDAEVRPLGTTQYEAPTSDLILAGRFRREVLPDVIAFLESLGGRVVVKRDEWPGSSTGSDGAAGRTPSASIGVMGDVVRYPVEPNRIEPREQISMDRARTGSLQGRTVRRI